MTESIPGYDNWKTTAPEETELPELEDGDGGEWFTEQPEEKQAEILNDFSEANSDLFEKWLQKTYQEKIQIAKGN